MNFKPVSLLIALSFLTAACAATGPADDGFENSQESLDIGRVFSEDGEAYTVYSTDDKNETSPTDAKTITDFEAYEQWKLAKDRNSPEYQKFRRWQEFEDFQRWKAQQEQ
ncbi:MAG: hypothetical protein ACC663_10875 [Gammaproteobacteria bacterium]